VSLRLRLLVSVGVALLASLALGGGVAFWHAALQVRTEMDSAIVVGANIVRHAIDDAKEQSSGGRQRWAGLINEFDEARHLQAFLVGRDDEVLLESRPEPPSDRVPGWFSRMLAGESHVVRIALPSDSSELAIVLKTDASNELLEAWNDIKLAFAVLAAFCIFVLAAVYWTLSRGLRPLEELTAAFLRVGGGDLAPRIAEPTSAELVRLGRAFNQMVERLARMQVQNARLNEQLTNVQAEERADLARELHDEIGPFLFAVGLDISSIRQITETVPVLHDELTPRLDAVRDAVAHMQKHLKAVLGRLRPAVLLDLGLAAAVENALQFWSARHPATDFALDLDSESFGKVMDEGIYRIITESLSNALRHGHPRRVRVSVSREAGNVRIAVVDDGGGLDSSKAAGFGIVGMRERAASLGGTLTVQNTLDGMGVIVAAQLPLHGSLNLPAREENDERAG
jgi:two-component system, NarL family, sensor histidine kinase UhpB